MCDFVTMPNGDVLRSVGDLRAQGWTVAVDDVDHVVNDDLCFCCVDVEAVLDRAGVAFRFESDYGGEWVVESV